MLAHTESFAMRCPSDCNRRTIFDSCSSCPVRWERCSTATSPSTEPFAATSLSFESIELSVSPPNRRLSSHLTKSKHLHEIGIERRKTKTLVSDGRNFWRREFYVQVQEPCSWEISVKKFASKACDISVWMYTSKLSWYVTISCTILSM